MHLPWTLARHSRAFNMDGNNSFAVKYYAYKQVFLMNYFSKGYEHNILLF